MELIEQEAKDAQARDDWEEAVATYQMARDLGWGYFEHLSFRGILMRADISPRGCSYGIWSEIMRIRGR